MDSAAFVVIIFLLPSVLAAYLYYLFAGFLQNSLTSFNLTLNFNETNYFMIHSYV